jgi:hypothetical protein
MSSEARSELVIRAPLSRVWQVLVDVDRYPAWNTALPRIARDRPGPLAVGDAIVVHARPLAPLFPHVFPCRVDTLVVERELAWTGPTTPARHALHARHGFVVEAVPEGTRFIHTEAFSGPALLPGVWRLLGPAVSRGHAEMNACLARACESAT